MTDHEDRSKVSVARVRKPFVRSSIECHTDGSNSIAVFRSRTGFACRAFSAGRPREYGIRGARMQPVPGRTPDQGSRSPYATFTPYIDVKATNVFGCGSS